MQIVVFHVLPKVPIYYGIGDLAANIAELAEHRGDVIPQILKTETERECDTIALGRRDKSMVGQFFMKGVVRKLLRKLIGHTTWVVE